MARDYAKQNQRNRSKGRGQKKSSVMLGVLAGLVLGLIIAGLGYLYVSGKIPLKMAANEKINRSVKKASGHSAALATAEEPQKPRFDFYTVLPKEKVWVPNQNSAAKQQPQVQPQPQKQASASPTPGSGTQEIHPLSAPAGNAMDKPFQSHGDPKNTPTQVASAAKKSTYLLQVASFQRYQDADKVKAQLALLGFNASIKTIQTNHGEWNRVLVGPFATQDTMKQAQQQLQQNNFHGFVAK